MTDASDDAAIPPLSPSPWPEPPSPASPPPLPVDTACRQVPPGIRDFISGTADEVVLAPGRLFWAELPGGVRPDVDFAPGPRRGSVEITVSLVGLGILETRVTVEVRDGRLHLDTSSVPDTVPGLGDVRNAVAVWLHDLHTWLAHHDKELGDLRLRRGRLRLGKVDRVDRIDRVDLWSGPNGTPSPPPIRARGCRTSSGSLTAALAATSRRALRRPSLW